MARKFHFFFVSFCILFAVFFGFPNFAHAQNAENPPGGVTLSPEMLARLEQLEAESAALRGELTALKKQNKTQNASAKNITATPLPKTAPPEQQYITHEELAAEIQKEVERNAWRSGEFRITPYGRVWASLIGATSQHAPEDTVMWIQPEDTHGQDTCILTARRSRVGLWMDGPDLCFWGMPVHTGGKVEIDFMGGINPTHNKPGILLREVYWKMENDDFKFLVGQTEDVISPLVPHALNYSLQWNAGNIGYRHPQVRLERYHYLSRNMKMEVQMSISQFSGSDFPNIDYVASFPTVQARVGWEIQRCWNPLPVRFGISGHYGQQGYATIIGDREIDSWSVNVDLSLPITERVGIQGEFFHGQGLASVAGGIEQSLDYRAVAASMGTLKSIHSTGGWGEIWWDITDCLHSAVGYGIDDPLDSDMTVSRRLSNSVLYVNLVYDLTKYLRTGIEYSYWTTKYRDNGTATASVIEWTWQFNF